MKRCHRILTQSVFCRRSECLMLLPMVFLAVAMVAGTPCYADPSESPVLRSLESTPWYDAETGRVVPIDMPPRVDDSINRGSRWLPKPKTVSRSTSTANQATTNTGGGVFGSSFTWGHVFGWVLLSAIVIGIVGTIVYAVSRAEMRMPGRSSTSPTLSADGLPDEQMLERIKHLPPELRRTDVNLRTECERLMQSGRFDQAIILLLGHQLLLLDRHGLLRLSRGKTNGRYVRETQSHDVSLGAWLRSTADAFEQSYFGRHTIPVEVFRELWKQNELLESAADSFGAVR